MSRSAACRVCDTRPALSLKNFLLQTVRSISTKLQMEPERVYATDLTSSALTFPSIPDWDQPITQEELDEIDAALERSSSSSTKRSRPCADDKEVRSNGRRLPTTLVGCQLSATSNRDRQIGVSEVGICSMQRSYSVCASSGSRSLHSKLAPCQGNLKVRYPTINFGGEIVYSRTFHEVEKATMDLLKILDAKKKSMDQITLGFDIEWRPTFRRGEAPGKAAVFQICGDTSRCDVMHIIHSGIPPILQSLLEDSTTIKVGVCIAGDATKVLKDYSVSVKALEDLSDLANLKLGGIPKKWSLRSLTEMVTCKHLEKRNKIRLGNWESDFLTREQLQYAATDAFVSWHLCQILRSFPDASNSQDEEVNDVQQL
ncbi:PREDICTED: Werner Syndrome-like exonuclease isoform X1 [Nelumbo nucifera]|uniref:3'-5' exonuclease n=1 Tax=Nelumbo nucifera TaxID=4432 RepID=A0A1U8B413_NELNU|nr:PREDICTED: Werner Syndrome-like exonuclease isoform X1 [Nelumbo nucifera]